MSGTITRFSLLVTYKATPTPYIETPCLVRISVCIMYSNTHKLASSRIILSKFMNRIGLEGIRGLPLPRPPPG